VIIDEAHSSQSGETATELKGVLGGAELRRKAQEMAEEEGELELERLFRAMAKRGQQPNMSFFAFTATPKHKTLAIFGRNGEPFHRYTMRQAIEEGFIEDVLKSYVTYKTYYKLIKKAEDDPNVERKKAAKALARFMRLHPHNIGQKTEVMVEHFQHFTRHKIGGHAKAMVVTGSRLEAVRYKQEFDRYIRRRATRSRAWSRSRARGRRQDPREDLHRSRDEWRPEGEGAARHLRQAGIPRAAGGREVPDRLRSAVAAHDVRGQAPGRHSGGADLVAPEPYPSAQGRHFRARFRQRPGEIQEAFRQYYEGSVMGEQVDPDKLYEVKAELDASGIYLQTEVTEFARVFFAPKRRQSPGDHKSDERDSRSGGRPLRAIAEHGRGGSRTVARQTAGLPQSLQLPEPGDSLSGQRS
jgi:type I restriction enzyme R subunit